MSGEATFTTGEAAIVGAACRLPGAGSLEEFWDLMHGEANAIAQRPRGRWSVERFLRPGEPSPGFAYTFAGGYLDDPFAFDPAPFGISPREAQQMDPQQRLLLEATWSALEDAGIPPSSLAGGNVGVYVGASLVDYQSGAAYDPSVVGSHFMTGNSLSILSNRISYVFDLKGPSFTIDSACSSSFVALNLAMAALNAGEVDLAIVGGVNMLLSPAPFVGFSQARMLSPTGLCRPFSEEADGYVRSEGAVVLILQRANDPSIHQQRVRSVIVASAVSSDGRTSGISLPSRQAQKQLIDRLYQAASVDPDTLAFVEAHGTGTKVGDPVEAWAIGKSLGELRAAPLPVGSVKSNIGHLEAASGLAGLLKSSLSLERGFVPRSLFADNPNKGIDFASLNLRPLAQGLPLEGSGETTVAGVCNYGFGGTNAHVILRSAGKSGAAHRPWRRPRLVKGQGAGRGLEPAVLLVTAATQEALHARANQTAEALSEGIPIAHVAKALAYQHEILPHRLCLPLANAQDDQDRLPALLKSYRGEIDDGRSSSAVVHGGERPPLFVFSGNGCQFPQMGQTAYRNSAALRREIDDIDRRYADLAGWSIAEQFRVGVSVEDLARTSIAQPLIFALQSALAAVLRQSGITPAGVVGHSVGEIAAAECSGLISRDDALRIVHLRSRHQEFVRGRGRMLVLAVDGGAARTLILESAVAMVDVAAENSPASTTVSGPTDEIEKLATFARQKRIAAILLGVDYPFHSRILDPVEREIIQDTAGISFGRMRSAFYSTVTGESLTTPDLDPAYWWRNIRQPVLFQAAIEAAATAHPALPFVEISPRSILQGAIAETLTARNVRVPVIATLGAEIQEDPDPVRTVLARLIAHGIEHSKAAVFGADTDAVVPLRPYPFQREIFHLAPTSEALSIHGPMIGAQPLHPLLGARMMDGSYEWRGLLDPVLVPYLGDHRVDGSVVVPASAMIEMALAVWVQLRGQERVEIDEFEILRPLVVSEEETREVSTRYVDALDTVEIWSRRRFGGNEWLLHARGRLLKLNSAFAQPSEIAEIPHPTIATATEVYAEAARAGLEYGLRFQIVESNARNDSVSDSRLGLPRGGTGAFEERHVLHPISLDAAFHALFLSRPQRDGERKAHLPVRFRTIRIWKPYSSISRAITREVTESDRFSTVSVLLIGEDGTLAASIDAAVFRSVHLVKPFVADRMFREEFIPVRMSNPTRPENALPAHEPGEGGNPVRLILKAFSLALARRICLDQISTTASGTFEALFADTQRRVPERNLLVEAHALLDLAGAITSTDAGTVVAVDVDLPTPETLLSTLVSRFPSANTEARLAAECLVCAEGQNGALSRQAKATGLPTFWDLTHVLAPFYRSILQAVLSLPRDEGRPPRILVVGTWSQGLAQVLLPAVQQGQLGVTVAVPDVAAADSLRRRPGANDLFDILVLDSDPASSQPKYVGLIGVFARTDAGTDQEMVMRASLLLEPESTILMAEPADDPYLAFLFATLAGEETDAQSHAGMPAGTMQRWLALANAGIIAPIDQGEAPIRLFSARAATATPHDVGEVEIAFLAPAADPDRRPEFGLAAASLLAPDQPSALLDWLARVPPDTKAIIAIAPPDDDQVAASSLAERIESVVGLLAPLKAAARPVRLAILTSAARSGRTSNAAADASLWAFVRVAMNEFPEIDFRLFDIDPDADRTGIAALIASDGTEREWRLEGSGASVNRIHRGLTREERLDHDERSVLSFQHGSGLDGFEWRKAARLMPGCDEIEVEIAAAGLNYRDVLVGLGVLDDDLLGAGLTRAALGFECAGTVVRVGDGVETFRPGDAVMGFAAGTFSSHVVAPAWHFCAVPSGLPIEAAATIPVAFATAWYALVERGGIREGQDVLVHGGAGGVGMAAIQIAKLHKARVLATASTKARRALARANGADFSFDSRQGQFVAAIKQQFAGVDIVLNSLAGPAMQESFRLLKPFGRFLEIGKRDFLDNTPLSLRPFLRNILYAGIDLDELLAAQPDTVRAIMSAITTAFEQRHLRPLTYRVFEAFEAGAAFRTMQASEHIGKIVIRPPQSARRDIGPVTYRAKPGLHLVVGGTSGLGLATAAWLSAKGATHVALLSRRGAIDPADEAVVEEMRRNETRVLIEPLDVTDRGSVLACVQKLVAEHGPVTGVVHAAVHMDDGLIANLTPDRLRKVLGTKVDGIVNLDEATASLALDYFVAFSSATTLVGSPGQGAYVAGNAFLEGFMRRRRHLGKPGLAIGWGAISDVGIIARDRQLGQRLRRTTGVVAMRASEAMAHLGRLLGLGNSIEPVQYLTNIAHSAAAEKLALLRSPAYAALGLVSREKPREETSDLLETLRRENPTRAFEIVTGVVRAEVANILRMPEAKIDLARPLMELGLDSLMALELHMALESALGVQIALVGTGDRSLADLAQGIVAQLHSSEVERAETGAETAKAIAGRMADVHLSGGRSSVEASDVEQFIRSTGRSAS